MQDYEKLGLFYLGRAYDQGRGQLLDDLVMYDSADLTTHGLCVGMTGSGKTGLSICLLEEAAMDGIPALAIDPKGDLGNLLLTFPQLRPEDFRPWVDESEAARKGLSPDAAAAAAAESWRKGLASWGQDGERIARLHQAADIAIYTPGSTAGRSISVLRSLQAPADLQDTELVRERIQGAVSGLLALLGMDADPVRSREHILLCTIVEAAWQGGRDMGLPELIRDTQQPPFRQIGVMDLESVYPEKDRLALAVQLNNLLASPGFSAWMEGEPLDIGRLLYTAEGRPRISILSIAHLSDAERMFFVTLLLNEVVAWMRQQPGTPSLRALLYMDEIYGYFPPTAVPPCKRSMLTLLKQARAYGLGILLATQNPVDLDYKGLANTGTWLIGRLQTERDKARVLDGLEGAATSSGASFDRGEMDRLLSGLSNRVFLMHNVHETAPVVFQTRWAMSYLCGPLTREQIRRLTPEEAALSAPTPQPVVPTAPVPESVAPLPGPVSAATAAEAVPASVPQFFLPPTALPPTGATLTYRPGIVAGARIHYVRATPGVDHIRELALIAALPTPGADVAWQDALAVPAAELVLDSEQAQDGATLAAVPEGLLEPKTLAAYGKSLTSFLYASMPLRLYKYAPLKGVSEPGETEGQFRVRMGQIARERRDQDMAKIRAEYADRLAAVQERIRQAQERIARERSEHSYDNLQTAVTVGATLMGALLGRKVVSRRNVERASSAMRHAGRSYRGGQEVGEAEEALESQQERLAELQAEFNAALAEVDRSVDAMQFPLETVEIRPRKADITVTCLGLLWCPWATDATGNATPLFSVPASGAGTGL
jgi:prefoldin subunit 5